MKRPRETTGLRCSPLLIKRCRTYTPGTNIDELLYLCKRPLNARVVELSLLSARQLMGTSRVVTMWIQLNNLLTYGLESGDPTHVTRWGRLYRRSVESESPDILMESEGPIAKFPLYVNHMSAVAEHRCLLSLLGLFFFSPFPGRIFTITMATL